MWPLPSETPSPEWLVRESDTYRANGPTPTASPSP